MLRKLACVMFGCLLLLNVGLADSYRGKVKTIDAEKSVLTVTVNDKDQTFEVPKEARIFSLGKAKKGQPAPEVLVIGGLTGLKEGNTVTVTTEKKDDKEVVTSVKLETEKKKKKKKDQ